MVRIKKFLLIICSIIQPFPTFFKESGIFTIFNQKYSYLMITSNIPQISVRVECTPSDMIVSLSLANDFRGRIYATGNPQSCFELGTGRPDMTLRIPLGTECGTVQQVRDDAKMRHSVKKKVKAK